MSSVPFTNAQAASSFGASLHANQASVRATNEGNSAAALVREPEDDELNVAAVFVAAAAVTFDAEVDPPSRDGFSKWDARKLIRRRSAFVSEQAQAGSDLQKAPPGS